jgi:hypothetical protein
MFYAISHGLYSSPNNIVVTTSRRMTGARQVGRMGNRRDAYRVWWGNLKERSHLEEPDVHGRIILRWIFKKWDGETRTGFI